MNLDILEDLKLLKDEIEEDGISIRFGKLGEYDIQEVVSKEFVESIQEKVVEKLRDLIEEEAINRINNK